MHTALPIFCRFNDLLIEGNEVDQESLAVDKSMQTLPNHLHVFPVLGFHKDF